MVWGSGIKHKKVIIKKPISRQKNPNLSAEKCRDARKNGPKFYTKKQLIEQTKQTTENEMMTCQDKTNKLSARQTTQTIPFSI
jgi:hypothetical protein